MTLENENTMDIFNNRCNESGDPPQKSQQCVIDLYFIQGVQEVACAMGRLAAWSELSKIYHKFQLPAGCSGISSGHNF